MKVLFRLPVEAFLTFKAKCLLRRNKTKIIAITGSVGKTSTKEAIYQVLKKRFRVYRSSKSFNTPIGLSLTILQQRESGFSSPLAWLKILNNVHCKKIKMPDFLILEMGADHPGDIEKLVKIAQPDIAVITHIKPVHLAEGQFKDLKHIAWEKSHLIRPLQRQDLAVLNDDDFLIHKMNTLAHVITYGQSQGVVLQAHDIHQSAQALTFRVTYHAQTAEFKVPVLGEFQVYVCLPAIAIGLHLGMSLKECARALSNFHLPPGRMNPLPGIKGSSLIDGSYNASPATMEAALELLRQLPGNRKIAALGTMNELGEASTEAHVELGRQAARRVDFLVAVGQEAEAVKQGALEAGLKEEQIFICPDSKSAGRFLRAQVQEEDLILIKGSQNKVRMEHCVKRLMKYPQNAARVLCRQGKMWKEL